MYRMNREDINICHRLRRKGNPEGTKREFKGCTSVWSKKFPPNKRQLIPGEGPSSGEGNGNTLNPKNISADDLKPIGKENPWKGRETF
jgi:hypothetical protein